MPAATSPGANSPPVPVGRNGTSLPTVHYVSLLGHVLILPLSILGAQAYDNAAWVTLMAVAFGMAMVQLGFCAHDAEHQLHASRTTSKYAVSLACWNLLLGLSQDWWRGKHGAHHRNTHVAGLDPDLYFYVFDAKQAAATTGFQRLIVRHQDWMFWVMLLCARLYFQWLSVLHLIRRPSLTRLGELMVILLHHWVVWYAAWYFLPKHFLLFIGVGYGATGLYMGIVFATNHLGMPLAETTQDGNLWQVAHTRNIHTGCVGRYLFGGLQFQIEHHLYPHLSRHHLDQVAGEARERCRQAGQPYHEQCLLPALMDIHAALRLAARAASR